MLIRSTPVSLKILFESFLIFPVNFVRQSIIAFMLLKMLKIDLVAETLQYRLFMSSKQINIFIYIQLM